MLKRDAMKLVLAALAVCALAAIVVVAGASPLFAQAAPASSSATTQATPSSGAAAAPTSNQETPAKSEGMVWVNTDTGVYHKPGTRWYGKSKHGKYMLEADAIKAGYKPAKKTGAA
jgi:hypothetical protein